MCGMGNSKFLIRSCKSIDGFHPLYRNLGFPSTFFIGELINIAFDPNNDIPRGSLRSPDPSPGVLVDRKSVV